MSCLSIKFPDEFKQLPDLSAIALNRPNVKNLSQKITQAKNAYLYLPPTYKAHTGIRVVVIALLIVGIAIGIMALNGTLTSFPESFMHVIHNTNWIDVGIGLGAFAALSFGSALVIHHALHTKNPITHTAIGKLVKDDQWVSAYYKRDDMENTFPGYIDTSTLDEKGTGVAYMYAYKDEQDHYTVSAAVTLFTPLHMIGAIVYNALRLVLVPFLILACMLVEKVKGPPINPDDRPFQLSDIPIEMGKSLWRIIKAPFYALAVIFAAIFSFFDPLNFRGMGASFEFEWNEKVTRANGFWSVRGPQPLWKFEGGLTPSHLGKNGFYLAGCWQPMAVVHFENKRITKCESLSRAVDPKKGKPYTILTRSILIQNHNALVDQLEQCVHSGKKSGE